MMALQAADLHFPINNIQRLFEDCRNSCTSKTVRMCYKRAAAALFFVVAYISEGKDQGCQ